MPCYEPITGYRFNNPQDPRLREESGKYKVFFGDKKITELMDIYGRYHEVLTLPCGKCVGCKLRRSQEWATRCMHEARYHESSSFLTLTYNDENLPKGDTLVKKDFQDFMKRLRFELESKHGVNGLKYYMVGEYGENFQRPHYHALLYGWSFPDRIPEVHSACAERPLYSSPQLDRLWGLGLCRVGDLTEQSAAYCARYTMKKLHGEEAREAYATRQAPYNCMSKGIGRRYYQDFSRDMYPSDFLVTEGSYARVPIPRYYDKLHAEAESEEAAKVKVNRQRKVSKLKAETGTRLRQRGEAVAERMKALRRVIE